MTLYTLLTRNSKDLFEAYVRIKRELQLFYFEGQSHLNNNNTNRKPQQFQLKSVYEKNGHAVLLCRSRNQQQATSNTIIKTFNQ